MVRAIDPKFDGQNVLRKQKVEATMAEYMTVVNSTNKAVTSDMVKLARTKTIDALEPYYGRQLVQMDTLTIARKMGFPGAELRKTRNGDAVAHVGHISKKLDAILARQDKFDNRLTILEGMIVKHLGGNKL